MNDLYTIQRLNDVAARDEQARRNGQEQEAIDEREYRESVRQMMKEELAK